MNDTNPEIQKKIDELYAKLTPEEKFNKMLSMCKTVREIILSQMPETLSEIEKKKRLFKIYYERDFTRESFEKIFSQIFPD